MYGDFLREKKDLVQIYQCRESHQKLLKHSQQWLSISKSSLHVPDHVFWKICTVDSPSQLLFLILLNKTVSNGVRLPLKAAASFNYVHFPFNLWNNFKSRELLALRMMPNNNCEKHLSTSPVLRNAGSGVIRVLNSMDGKKGQFIIILQKATTGSPWLITIWPSEVTYDRFSLEYCSIPMVTWPHCSICM